MPAGRVARGHTAARGGWMTWGGMGGREATCIRSDKRIPMHGDCMTCTGMCRSGVRTDTRRTWGAVRWRTRRGRQPEPPASCAAGAGRMMQRTAGRRLAAGFRPPGAWVDSGSVRCFARAHSRSRAKVSEPTPSLFPKSVCGMLHLEERLWTRDPDAKSEKGEGMGTAVSGRQGAGAGHRGARERRCVKQPLCIGRHTT